MTDKSNNKATSFSSITLLLLKELRIDRHLYQSYFAEAVGKSASAYTKIETGRTSLSLEMFFRLCTELSVPPSYVLAAAERYAALLGRAGWAVMSKQLEFNEDDLLKDAQDYYSSLEHQSTGYRGGILEGYRIKVPVLNSPIYHANGSMDMIEVFFFALNSGSQKTKI